MISLKSDQQMALVIQGKFQIEGTEDIIIFEDPHFAEEVVIEGESSIWATWSYEDSPTNYGSYIVPIEGESLVKVHEL